MCNPEPHRTTQFEGDEGHPPFLSQKVNGRSTRKVLHPRAIQRLGNRRVKSPSNRLDQQRQKRRWSYQIYEQ